MNKVQRYSFLIECDLFENITDSQVLCLRREITKLIENSPRDINHALGDSLFWQVKIKFLGNREDNKC